MRERTPTDNSHNPHNREGHADWGCTLDAAAARTAEIARILEGREHEERMARRNAMEGFKLEWEAQRQAASERKKKVLDFGDAPEKCGLASLQKLTGEDESAAERRKLQADQVGGRVGRRVSGGEQKTHHHHHHQQNGGGGLSPRQAETPIHLRCDRPAVRVAAVCGWV